MKKNIEIEHRARFSKADHDRLIDFLQQHGQDLGQDDKNVYFFTFPDKLLKVTDNISKQTAKITGKLNKIGHGSGFEEIEFPIARADVEKAVKLFTDFGFTDVHSSFQQRYNFIYQGVEIAMKFSELWGYHAELEIVVSDEAEKPAADEKIQSVAKELQIVLMTEDELKNFIAAKEKEIKAAEHQHKKKTF